MPSRIIREGIITSDRVNKLDAPAEVFYRRLLNKVDDYGLHDARPSILLATLYPLQLSKVREANIVRWLAEVESANLVRLYVVDGKSYLQVLDTKWPTRSEPKCPLPPGVSCAQPARSCAPISSSYSGSSSSSSSQSGGGGGARAASRPPPRPKRKTEAEEAQEMLADLQRKKAGAAS